MTPFEVLVSPDLRHGRQDFGEAPPTGRGQGFGQNSPELGLGAPGMRPGASFQRPNQIVIDASDEEIGHVGRLQRRKNNSGIKIERPVQEPVARSRQGALDSRAFDSDTAADAWANKPDAHFRAMGYSADGVSAMALLADGGLMGQRQPRPDFGDVSPGRRRNMAANVGKNTMPEILVRKLAHKLGYRFRLHVKGLPGRPDVVFPARRKIIDVRGCFWHRHQGCAAAATPATRPDFWRAKFDDTVSRDARNLAMLENGGWEVMVIWECETRQPGLDHRLRAFLGPSRATSAF